MVASATNSVALRDTDLDAVLRRNQALESELKLVREQLEWLKRQMFGSRSEKLPVHLASGAADLFGNTPAEPDPSTVTVPTHDRKVATKAGHGREKLPEGLPVETIVLDLPETEMACGECGKDLVKIGEDTREELHIVSPRFIVRRYVRPIYACRVCTELGVKQVPPPVTVIDKGIPSVELVVWVLLSKYLDHLPLHRIASQFKRWGVEVAETTMIGWIAAVFDLLGPIQRAMEHEIRTCGCVHADETTLRVQRGDKDKHGRGRTSTGYLWAVLGRGRDGTPMAVSFHYAPGRQHVVAKELLEHVTGIAHTDGYEAYERLFASRPDVVHAACWAHVRRKFMDALESGYHEANDPLKMIATLYEVRGSIDAVVERLTAILAKLRISAKATGVSAESDRCPPWSEEPLADKLDQAVGLIRNRPLLDAPLRAIRCALHRSRSQMASAAPASPKTSDHCSIGTWLVTTMAPSMERSSTTSKRMFRCSRVRMSAPRSSRTSSLAFRSFSRALG